MAKPKSSAQSGESAPPTSYPNTTPQVGSSSEVTSWVMSAMTKNTEAIAKLDGTLSGLSAQLGRMESDLKDIKSDVKGHGKWIFAANAVLGVLVALLLALSTRIWDLVMRASPALPGK